MFTEAQFNRSTLECMTILRRRLKQELGVTIRMSEEGAADAMIQLSTSSQQSDIRELGQRLLNMIRIEPEPEQPAAFGQGAIASRQRLMQGINTAEAAPASRPQGPSTVRIYRGQVVRQ
ncbi:hypothetical protein [Halopseudomonas salina]|uniref:Flagellar hook-length control protein FliK n=1 Tax=Halopseudomonas salina TaxID=1323744 RepID=A0ABQ1PK71_9GAMM|nr:hypothetical protein [Halopseudomonas salina]GGC98566.1 hypothetical protein GCM10007418_17390 [Halopseudomonas salina]